MGRSRRAHGGVADTAASCLELASLGREGPGSVSSASVCSAFSYLDGDADDIQVDDFERRLDALFEKRGSTREKALEALAVMLRVDYRVNDCNAHTETLTSRCLTSLKRGSPVEASLAAQLLGLHILTLGQPDERLFQSLRPDLERAVVGATGGGPAVQAAAMDTLALAAFVLGEDEGATRAVMARLRASWCAGDAKTRAAAVRGWSFLLTSLSGPLGEQEAATCLSGLGALLHPNVAGGGRADGGRGGNGGGPRGPEDLDLRTAAGEAVAVLRSCCGDCDGGVGDGGGGGWRCGGGSGAGSQLGVPEEADGEEAEGGEGEGESEEGEAEGEVNGEGRRRQYGGAAQGGNGRRVAGDGGGNGSGGGELSDLVERMQELAANKGDPLRRSRRDRASQRSTFRGLLAALAGESTPECRIRLRHGDAVTVRGLAATHRLAFLRRFLAGGFQAHLQHNPLLHDVFGFRPRTERPERLTPAEKRLSRSCHSADARARTADRRCSRDAKAASHLLGFGY